MIFFFTDFSWVYVNVKVTNHGMKIHIYKFMVRIFGWVSENIREGIEIYVTRNLITLAFLKATLVRLNKNLCDGGMFRQELKRK